MPAGTFLPPGIRQPPVGAVTREGGNTTEATTTSTSQTDLLSTSSLSIAAAAPFLWVLVMRKTSGAANAASGWLKINATSLDTASGPGGAANPWDSSNTNQAENGVLSVFFGARVTNYLATAVSISTSAPAAAGIGLGINCGKLHRSAVMPNAEVTDVIIVASTDSASQTVGADESHVYTFSTS